ncbi:hypothetical protein L0222_07395 [bacterium]|nr:hypothetical protein [bacterium]
MNRILCILLLFFCPFAFAEDTACPHHAEHQAQMEQRGDRVMGFDHTKTIHHFLLKQDGGVIVAEAREAKDLESIENIRRHFVEIKELFSQGDFSKPKEIHERVPPGVEEMILHRNKITYSFHETELGGEVRIKTASEEARKAIHAFLRFQIEDHHTGDSLEVQSD